MISLLADQSHNYFLFIDETITLQSTNLYIIFPFCSTLQSAADKENRFLSVSEPNPHQSRSHSVSSDFNPRNSNSFPGPSHSSSFPAHPNHYTSRNFDGNRESTNNRISFANSVPLRRSQNTDLPIHGSKYPSSSENLHSRSSNYLNINETDDFPISERGKIPKANYHDQKWRLEDTVTEGALTTTQTPGATDIPYAPRRQEANYPSVHPSLVHLLPLYKPLGQEFDYRTNSPDNVTHLQRNIESEVHPFDTTHREQDYKFSQVANGHNTSQDPDVSVNVLEIPRITKQFENTAVNLSFDSAPRTVSVHEVPNSVERYPSVPRIYYRNPTYSLDGNFSNAEETRLEFPVDSKSGGSSSHFPQSHISTTITPPVLTTPEYFVTDRTTSSVYVPSVHTAFQNSEDFNSFQIFPSYVQNNNTPSFERNLTALPLHASDVRLTHDSTTSNVFSTTQYPLTENKRRTSLNHRSDIPSEDSNGKSSLPHHLTDPSFINRKHQNENVPPERIRYQNALRDFKPDEIVIDVENVPTHTFPPVTSSFQHRILTTTQPPVRSLRPGGIPKRNEQTSGSSWQPFYPATRYPRRRINDKMRRPIQQSPPIVYPQRVSLNQNIYPGIRPQPQINQLVGVNQYNTPSSRRQLHYPPSRSHPPVQLNQIHHFGQLGNLPPGVSMHPRHPQAPFADMVHSNRPPTIPLTSENQPALKPHRQRHHRKKDRHLNSCCRLRGKTGAFQSCCRNGGPCCSVSQRRLRPPGSPCCSSSKASVPVVAANQIQPPVRTANQIVPPIRNEEMQRSDTNIKDRCQKEKMCRTVYESTQQVMVCRNAHVEGC